MLKPMEKIAELKRAKLLALSLLIAVAIFITAATAANAVGQRAKSHSEAAMVGALADWFAVVALFRRIPLPFIRGIRRLFRAIRTESPIISAISCRKNFSIPRHWWR
jgi:uncharacterized membrane-anchored protein YjiN (DUF445 family)